MQIKDIVIGSVYSTNHGLAVVLAKGKYRVEYAQHFSHDLDFAGVIKQTLTGRWYVSDTDPKAKANSVVLWIPDYKRIDVVASRQVQRLLHRDDVTAWIARQSSGEEQSRIQAEESERFARNNEILAFALADVLGRDHSTLASWDKHQPWRMVTENEAFVKKATLAYMKILAAKGESIGGAPAEEIIEEVKTASTELKQAQTRKAARLAAAETKALAQAATLTFKTTVAPTPRPEHANA